MYMYVYQESGVCSRRIVVSDGNQPHLYTLTYAHVCSRMPTPAYASIRERGKQPHLHTLTSADVADVC